MSYYGGEIKYSFVKVRILKCSISTWWYKDLVGQIMEVRKLEYDDGHITYKHKTEAADFHKDDVEEVK